MSLTINIPEEHYVTFHFRDNDIYPLGFLVPEGKDKAAQNRKATADRWANSSKVKVPAKVFTNKPMVGFEIRKSVRYRGRNSTRETWRIIDPRGFELEISNSNMEFIIDHCILDKGEIISSCIWGREGSDNLLLPVDSKEYKEAIANTERLGKKASMKEVKLGDHVTFKKGNKGRYLGKYFKYTIRLDEYDNESKIMEPSSAKQYVFEGPDGNLIISSSTQVSEINKSEPISEADAEAYVNQVLNKTNKKYRYNDSTVALIVERVMFDDFDKEFVPVRTINEALLDGFYHSIINNGQNYWLVDNQSVNRLHNSNDISAYDLEKESVAKFEIKYVMVSTSSYYGRNHLSAKRSKADIIVINTQFTLEGVTFKYLTANGNDILVKL